MRLVEFCALGVIVLTACTSQVPAPTGPAPAEERGEWLENWLSKPKCNPPCWEGISPGITSASTAMMILAELPYGGETLQEADGSIRRTLPNQDEVFLRVSSEVIDTVYLDLSTQENLTLKEVVSVYHEPTEVVLYSCQGGVCEVEIHWRNLGLIAVTVVPDIGDDRYRAHVDSSARVGKIVMVESTELWFDNYPVNEAPPAPWHGYGEYP